MRATQHTLPTEVKATLWLAAPVVLTQLGQISMGFVDTVMVGRLGSDALAGVALGNTCFFFTMVLGMGVLMAVQPMVSQAFGAGENDPIGRTVRQGLWLGLILGTGAFLLLWNITPLLRLLGQQEETIELAQGYLRAIAGGVFPFLWFVVLRSFVEGVSKPRPVAVIAFLGVAFNIGANYVLMFGKLGFPELGIVGTGWASMLVFWCNFMLLLTFVRRNPGYRPYRLFARLGKPDPHYFRELFRIGWPIGASLGTEFSLFMITVMMMGWISTTAMAAHQIAIQCAAFTFMVPLGIGIATTVRVGQAVGRKDPVGVRWAGFVGILLSAVFMFGAALLFWTAPRTVVGLYLDLGNPDNDGVVDLAVKLLSIAAVFQVVDGVQVSASGALRGLKDTRIPMLIGLVSYLILGLTTSYTLGFRVGLGAVGLWWGLVLGLASAAVLLSMRFYLHSRSALALVVNR
jgi:MATE family multidrug resistance protein